MTRYAYVDDIGGGVVTAIADSHDPRTGNWVVCSNAVRIGWAYTAPGTFEAPEPTASAYGASLIRVVNAIEAAKIGGGYTYSGVEYPTNAKALARASIGRQHTVVGTRKTRGKTGQITENNADRNARIAALNEYLDAVEAYAYDLIASIDTEIGNDDLPALQAIAAGFGTGWPSDVIS
jgi:hypothetical protein